MMATDSPLSAAFAKPFAEQLVALRLRLGNQIGTKAWDDLVRAQHERSFVVAGAMKADLLADLAKAVERAIGEHRSLETFRAEFRQIVTDRGWHGWTGEGTARGEAWRTRVIYRTNMATSYAAGRMAQLVDGKFKFWVYKHGNSLEPRLQHLAWDGIALPPDHPFWETHAPPNGWGCTCRISGANSPAGVRRAGGDPDKALPGGWQTRNPRTGTPEGIDKGWDYKVGGSVAEEVIKAVEAKVPTLPAQLADDLAISVAGRNGQQRLPYMDFQPGATLRDAGQRAIDQGVVTQIGLMASMKVDGINTILRTAQEVKERFNLSALRYLGDPDQHPAGRIRLPKNFVMGYVPRTNSVVFRTGATDPKKVHDKFDVPLPERDVQRWRTKVSSLSQTIQERAARIPEWRWAEANSLERAMVHEMGHRLHRAYQAQIDDLQFQIQHDDWKWLISEYGATKWSEYVAECFVLYLRGGLAGHDRIAPRLLELFRKLDGVKP